MGYTVAAKSNAYRCIGVGATPGATRTVYGTTALNGKVACVLKCAWGVARVTCERQCGGGCIERMRIIGHICGGMYKIAILGKLRRRDRVGVVGPPIAERRPMLIGGYPAIVIKIKRRVSRNCDGDGLRCGDIASALGLESKRVGAGVVGCGRIDKVGCRTAKVAVRGGARNNISQGARRCIGGGKYDRDCDILSGHDRLRRDRGGDAGAAGGLRGRAVVKRDLARNVARSQCKRSGYNCTGL